MTRDEARQQIQDMLGHNVNPTVATKIDAAFRFVQNELESEATLPFFLQKVDDSLSTVIDENIIERPSDFIRFYGEDPFSLIIEGENFPLKKGSAKYIRQRYTGETFPMGFSEIGEEFQIFPVPTAEYSLILSYYAKEKVLLTNIENKWLKYLPGLMIGRAGFIVATGLRDTAAQQLFGALAAAGTEKLHQMSTAQEESGARLVIGGED